MTQPINEVEVFSVLPIEAYAALDRKAKKLGISVGRLIGAFVVASLRTSPDGTPKLIIETDAPPTIEANARRVSGVRSYVRIGEAELPRFRELVRAGKGARELSGVFGVSMSSAANWRRRILTEDAAASAGELPEAA